MKKDQNRKMFNKPLSIFICLLCIGITISIGRSIYEHQRDKSLRAAPVKIYKTTPEVNKTTIKKTNGVVETPTDLDATKSFIDPNETRTPSESKTPTVSESSLPRREDALTDASESSVSSEDAEKAKADQSKRQADLKKRIAETDALLEESRAVVSDGKASLHQAGTLLANHLNSLSKEDQVAFLEETRKALMGEVPSDADPEIIEKSWQTYLDMLSDSGYVVPAEVK